MYQSLLALALITSPPEDAEALATPEAWAVAPLVQDLAVQWELLDLRERPHFLARWEEFATDLRLLQRRYEELHDAPPLSDADRLPPRSVSTDRIAFNRAYRSHLDGRRSLEPHRLQMLEEAIAQTDALCRVHDAARDARCEYFYCTPRRAALKRLRDQLGPEAYYAGRWPPHVPVHLFRPID